MSGFIYVWYDRHNKMFYIGSHWGAEDDGYICSSSWMNRAYKQRPHHFKRRIVARGFDSRETMIEEETRWLGMIKPNEIKPANDNPRYYNLNTKAWVYWHVDPKQRLTIGEKISAAKKGKSTGPCSPEKAKAISEAKKQKFAERKALTGSTGMPATRGRATGWTQSPEWKAAHSERLKQQWACGKRSKKDAADRCRLNNPNS